MCERKRGNPHPLPKARSRCANGQPLARPRLTLHESDPITGNEDALYTLFYEGYRGYTIYSTPEGHCCIHGRQGCLKLRGRFVCFPDIEEAKAFIKRLRAQGDTSYDDVERYLPEWEYVWLSWKEQLHSDIQRVS